MPALSGCDRIGSKTPQQHIQRAKDFQAKGDARASIIELKSALQTAPDNAEARWLLGEIYAKAGQGGDAEKELLQAQKLGINEESIKVPLGQALLLQQSYQRVLNEIKPSPQTSPKNMARILEIQGAAQVGLGHFDEGCSLFKQSQNADASYAPAYRGVARCLASRRDLDGAKGQLDIALKLDSKDAETWVSLGDFESFRNNRQAAEAAYLSAKRVDARNVGAYLGLASLYVSENALGKAENELTGARKTSPNNLMVRYMQALVAFKQKKFSAARDDLDEILKVAPDHMPSVLLSGAVAYSLGTYEQAEKLAFKFLGQFPNSVYARKLIAATLLKMNRAPQALDTLKPALAQDAQDADLLALAGEVGMAMKEYAKAAEYLEKAAAMSPKDARVRTELGMSQLGRGDAEQAIAQLESAATLDPARHEADTALVSIYIGKKQFDQALAAVAALEKKQPNDPATFNLKGTAYLGKNDFANARKSFEQALTLQPSFVAAAVNLAQLDLKDKNPKAASERFKSVLANDRNNLQAMLALSQLAASQGHENEYVSWLESAAKANPGALTPRASLAHYYVKKKEPQKALALAHEAQTADPTSPFALHLLGTIQLAVGENENALSSFTQLTKLAPDWALAYYNLAAAQAATKDSVSARASLYKALELQPEYPSAQATLITLEALAGEPLKALKIAQQMQVQSPKSPVGFVLEGDVQMGQRKFTDAQRSYEKAFALRKGTLIAIKLYQARGFAGDISRAEAGLLQWLREQPDDVVARSRLAQAYMQSGRNKQAIQQYEVMLRNNPKNILLLNNLALLYQKEQDPRALATAEQAVNLDPRNASILDTLGWILVEQGKAGRGVEVLEKASSAAPKDPEIGYHYAIALAKSGENAKARKQIEALLSSGRKFPQEEQAKALLKKL